MRVTSVDLYSSDSTESLEFSLNVVDPQARYQVKEILGLDAEEITAKFYGTGLYTKPRFHDMHLKPRTIVLRTALNPNYEINESVSDIRDALYRSISSSRPGGVILNFNSGATTVARISGFITKFEVPYFTRQPEVTVTIDCADPMFRGLTPYSPIEGVLDPTASEVIVPDSLSTAPHGFSFQATFDAAAASFTIQDDPVNPEWKFKVIPSGGFLDDDVLHFSSDWSNKYLYVVRAGITTHLVNRLEPGAVWPTIFPGTNKFYFMDYVSFHFDELEFYPAYWGV